ncbi:hypothetical protein P353_15155 [Comamonas testosteroni]|uniref:Uncharacterized protein n=1 Tax=Comamonas testosteroni TaxID=285 RepID=A0A096GTR6_COMTE|nr:hypothetical protein P353_15155 [Comamonas testosteroni]
MAILVYGGLILLAFFVQLGSMPDLDLAGATATFAAVAVIGLLVVTVLGISTIVAGLATRSLTPDVPNLANGWSLGFLAAPGGVFIIGTAVNVSFDTKGFEPAFWLGLALLLVLPASFFSWLIPFAQQKTRALRADPASKNVCWIQLLLTTRSVPQVSVVSENSVPDTASNVASTESSNSTTRTQILSLGGDYLVYLMCCFMWFVSSAFTAFITYDSWARQGSAGVREGGALAMWGIASILLNILLVKVVKKMLVLACIALGGAAVLILTILTASWFAIPVSVVRNLGLGEIPVGVVVTAEGCDTFNKAARGQKVCQMSADEKLGWVCPVVLKSRIGAPMVFELASFGDDGNWPIQPFEIDKKAPGGGSKRDLYYPRIQVAKSEVKSWPSITSFKPDPNKKTGATSAQDNSKNSNPRPLVSYLNRSAAAETDAQRQWLLTQCGAATKADVPKSEASKKPKTTQR